MNVVQGRTHLRVEDISVHWLIVVILVSIFIQRQESVLQNLIDGSLATSSGPNTHESMPHQLGLIELDHFTDL